MKTIFCLSEAFREGSDGYFQRISACIVFFIVVHVGAKVASNWSPLLASRPTVVGATIHGVLTSWLGLAPRSARFAGALRGTSGWVHS